LSAFLLIKKEPKLKILPKIVYFYNKIIGSFKKSVYLEFLRDFEVDYNPDFLFDFFE